MFYKDFTKLSLSRRQWHPTPVLLPGKSHGQRSLVGCSPWGHEESDRTERLHFHFSLSCIGEGNGSPLQCSCLENPREGGAWRAAVYGVTQSRTQLKWLSSSSNAKVVTKNGIWNPNEGYELQDNTKHYIPCYNQDVDKKLYGLNKANCLFPLLQITKTVPLRIITTSSKED